MQVWAVDYDNSEGPNGDGFCEWWNVTNGPVSFKVDTEKQAEWLADVLNNASEEAGYVEIC